MTSEIQTMIETIWTQIEPFDNLSRQQILRSIEKKLKTNSSKLRISDFWGVGSEIWQHVNVNDYIRKERDSWD
ncbi:MAG: hypothetical protein LBI18_13015 [Planctomycetaceae bacterium]|jgi:hypothetical protein|nr:hypothetical protein [Planctomycetaceae bacterium]